MKNIKLKNISVYEAVELIADKKISMTLCGLDYLCTAMDNVYLWADEIYESPEEVWVDMQNMLKNPYKIYEKVSSWELDGPWCLGSYDEFLIEVTTP